MADCETGQCPPEQVKEQEQAPVYHAPAEVVTSHADAARPHDPLDPSTFIAPLSGPPPAITIEFCDRCRWLHRATWVQTELFLTFPPPALTSITLIPLNSPETGGRFRVWLTTKPGEKSQLVWDRKVEEGFPELKVLKQRIRDVIQPGTSLGHSDRASKTEAEKETPSPYQLFMKERLPVYKAEHPDVPHKDAFRAVALEWKDSDQNPNKGA